MLHGRAAEFAAIERLLVSASHQQSGALIFTGEAGIGKTALLAHAAQHANGMQVLRVVGVESEAELAFAGLHQLLWPLHDDIERLPSPQADALRVAFGLAAAPADGPNPFLVALATLSLLAEAAEERPVLCLVDDAHWLDGSSADALLFVARRLQAEGVAMLFAARETEGNLFFPPGVPGHRLSGLNPHAAAALLGDISAEPLAPDVVQELIVRLGGNPLALVEVSPLLGSARRAGAEPLPDTLPLSVVMLRAFVTRVRQLPRPTQTLLEVVAADDTGELAAVLSVLGRFDVGDQALSAAEDVGLLRVGDGRVMFDHPLMRAAVYQGTPFDRRRAVHLALADAPGLTPDRRAWHLAAAARGPDDSVAAALEATADEARRRSGHSAAAAALRRAAELSTAEQDKVRRLVRARKVSGWPATRAALAPWWITRPRPLRAFPRRLRSPIFAVFSSSGLASRLMRPTSFYPVRIWHTARNPTELWRC